MATETTISALPAASGNLTGAEVFAIDQGAATRKLAASQLLAYFAENFPPINLATDVTGVLPAANLPPINLETGVTGALPTANGGIPSGGAEGDVLTQTGPGFGAFGFSMPTPLVFGASFKLDATTQVGNLLISIATQSSGWGTPTGAAVQSNLAGGSATLPQVSAALAQIIIALQQAGLLGT